MMITARFILRRSRSAVFGVALCLTACTADGGSHYGLENGTPMILPNAPADPMTYCRPYFDGLVPTSVCKKYTPQNP